MHVLHMWAFFTPRALKQKRNILHFNLSHLKQHIKLFEYFCSCLTLASLTMTEGWFYSKADNEKVAQVKTVQSHVLLGTGQRKALAYAFSTSGKAPPTEPALQWRLGASRFRQSVLLNSSFRFSDSIRNYNTWLVTSRRGFSLFIPVFLIDIYNVYLRMSAFRFEYK